MERLTLLAPAKLNLRLEVGPLAEDGYHPLRSLMVVLQGLADTVQVTRSHGRRVACAGMEGPSNLAWAALDALEAEVGRALPLEIVIAKRIPVKAGLGGGSSDAAAVLVAADRLHALALGHARLEAVAARVGSDVPFFIRGGCQWAEGRGERLAPGRAPGFAALLLHADAGLRTAEVYRAFDRLPRPAQAACTGEPAGFADLVRWIANDLWRPALGLRPGLGRTARALTAAGAQAVLLCGSGSCVAGLFPDVTAAGEAAARLPAGGFRAVAVHPADGERVDG